LENTSVEQARHTADLDGEVLRRAVEMAIDSVASHARMSELCAEARIVNGIVVLTGWSSSAAARWALGEVTLAVPGVHSVINDVRLSARVPNG
jgi:fructose-bisphosphate aldolase class 1